jgi:tetratricopeptide (TPR) repeat protein
MLSKAPAPAPRSAKPALKADAVKSEILLESAEKPQQAGARDAAEAGPREDIAKGGGTGLQAGASPAALAPEAVGAPAAAAPRFQERESGKARAEQTAPIRASRDTARRYVERGDALLAQGELDRAVSNYESAVELAPQDVEALTKLGDALLRQGKKEEALGRFTEAARLEPRNTAALCGLGRAFDLLGRKEEAIQQFRKALEVDPNCAPAKQGLGEN